MEYIQLDRGSVQRFGIRDADGKETGEYIEIDPEDMYFQFRSKDCGIKHKNNVEELKIKVDEIQKTCKDEGEFPTEKDIALKEAFDDFLKKEEQAIDEFIGEGTTRKLLNGRKPYLFMFNDIFDMLSQIAPTLRDTSRNLIENIRAKYKKQKEKDDVL